MTFLARVFLVPVLINGVCDLGKPGTIFDQIQNIRRGKELDSIGRRVAERLEQPGRDENRDIMRLAAQHPARFFDGKPGGQLPRHRKETQLIFFHAKSVAGLA